MTDFYVGVQGGDYASIAAAWAALPSTFSEDCNIFIRKEGGGTNGEWTFSSQLYLTGKTISPYRLTITPVSGSSFYDGTPLNNALRYNPANGVALNWNGDLAGVDAFLISNSYVTLDGLQIYSSHANVATVLSLFGSANCIVRNCIIAAATLPYGAFAPVFKERNGNTVVNCLVYAQTATAGIYCAGQWNAGVYTPVRNCTVVNTGSTPSGSYAFFTEGSGANIKNNCGFGFETFVDNTTTGDSGNNIGNDATSGHYPGSNNLAGYSASNQFTSVTGGSEDFRVKAGANVIDAGVRDQSYTSDLDIVGSARSTTAPTIGAWEYVAAGPDLVTYRPASDKSNVGSWTTSSGSGSLASHIDEATPNHADFIQSPANPSIAECQIYWEPISTPSESTNHTFKYWLRAVGGGSVAATVQLVAGDTTVIASWETDPVLPAWTEYTRTLTQQQMDDWLTHGYANSYLKPIAGT